MQYIINLKSQTVSGTTHWSGGVAPVHKAAKDSTISIAMSESVLTTNKNNITDEIQRRLSNENFITNEITHGMVRVGSLEELMDRLAQVQ